MTPEQKFFFDLHGWILLPAVLSPVDIDAMKREVYDGAKNSYEGSLQNLLDHPAILSILTELLAEPSFVSSDYYRFRCEGSFVMKRSPGWRMSEKVNTEGTGIPLDKLSGMNIVLEQY